MYVSIENKQHKNVLQSRAMVVHPMSWPKDSQKYDLYAFNRFEEKGHDERKFNHFRLIDLTRDNLYDMGIPGGNDDED